MCRLQNIAMRDYQESVTTGHTHRQTETHRQTADKVIPMCGFASQATQKCVLDLPIVWRRGIQANSYYCGLPRGNKFDLEVDQRSRSRHGANIKGLTQGMQDHECQMLFHQYFRRNEPS